LSKFAPLAHDLTFANNTALEADGSSHPNVQVLVALQLTEAIFADPHRFGFIDPLQVPWASLLATHPTQFTPKEPLKKSSTGVSRCDSKESIGVEIWIGR
jgi:hypothetical protein